MTHNNSLQGVMENYVSFQSTVMVGFVDQILKSPEFISKYGDLPVSKKRKIYTSRQKIMEKILEAEFNEIVKKYNIKSETQFYNKIDSLESKKVEKERIKMALSEVNKIISS